jgi:nucleoside-diphosphate-sugar epimerase
MKRLLLTGGSGFIGRHCLPPAILNGYEVHATTSGRTECDHPNVPGVRWHSVDLLDPGRAEALIAAVRPSHILHTAWVTTHGSYWTSPTNLAWLGLLTRILPIFADAGGVRFVSTGSCAEYDWSSGTLVEDETPERPITFYGRIKVAHHQTLMAASDLMGFSAATGRVFFGYGPFEGAERLVPYACRQLARFETAELSKGLQVRDFLAVEDIGRGLVHLLDSDIGGACNVASGKPVTIAEIITILGRVSGRPGLVRLGGRPERPSEPDWIVGSNARLRSSGWEPQIDLEIGLKAAYEWWFDRVSKAG